MPEQINDTTFEATLVGGDKVEIGDKESTDFKPHIKLNRWGGECFIAIKPANLVEGEVEYEVEGDKVKCKYKVKYEDDTEEEFEAEFYPLEPRTVIAKDKDGNDVEFRQNELGGFEFEVILKKKPKTNKIILDIETQGLKFYYQPELTPEEIADGAVRPDNVVGSYAVYHATKRDHIIGKTNYMVGKAFHINRPKIVDDNGWEVWGELNIDLEKGKLYVEMPNDFYNNATYPVRHAAGLTFGNTDSPETSAVSATGYINWTDQGYSPANDGTAVSMSIYARDSGDAVEMALYEYTAANTGDKVDNTEEVLLAATVAWRTATFSSPPNIQSAKTYHLCYNSDNNFRIYSDNTVGGRLHWEPETYGSWPASIESTGSISNYEAAIYCTYEEEVGGETHYGAVVLSGIGTLAGIPHVTFIGKSTLSGSGTLAAIGVRLRTGLATLSGSGALSAIGRRLKTGLVTFAGAGSLTAIGRRVFAGAATLAGSGLLTGKGVLTVIGKATLSGVGTLATIGTVILGVVIHYGSVVLSGVGTLTASGVRIFTGVTTLTGSGALVVNGVKTAIGKVTLAGTGALAIVGGLIRTGAVTFAGVGTLATIGSLIKTGIATLTGSGTLVANAVMTYGGKATLSGIGTLTAILSRVVLVFEGRKLGDFVGRTLKGFTGRDLEDDNDEHRRIM